ncbi:aminoacyltransferase [Methanoplanus sp. FWC-SCC4]|uniref:Aminoacyltransferase n=1 Tax=Methanochimaera problematica TaxID=2609417 RepID=A0AA97FCH3_9EURY|nr:peptidoglycan bridge formation glycyltransferase FemA/FemB family protein [Methanoplanus sp. FWC-SCC4]WOF16347.1 aminoacyltransferase [Methanoplanus sp. FWC-SCC4]
MEIILKVASEKDTELWDNIVESSPQGSIFHTMKWLKIAEKYSDCRLIPVIGYNNTVPIAILPLFYKKKLLLRMVFSPPPHVGIMYLGPVFVDYDSLKQNKKEIYYEKFQNELDKFIQQELRANYISIFLPPNLPDPRPFKWAGYEVEPTYDYHIDLSCGIEQIWQNFKKKIRVDVKKSLKQGVILEEGEHEEIDAINALLVKRYDDQNRQLSLPKEYLHEIYDSFGDNVKVTVAKFDGKIVTGSIKLQYKDEVLSWIGSTKPYFDLSPSPNSLLSWEEIKEASEKNICHYIRMGTAGNQRLHSHFSKFDPDLRLRFNVKKASALANFAEKGYVSVLKPVSGIIGSKIKK